MCGLDCTDMDLIIKGKCKIIGHRRLGGTCIGTERMLSNIITSIKKQLFKIEK